MLNGKRILIEQAMNIGDMVMLTPVLRRLKEMYPNSILTLVTHRPNISAVKGLPYIDAIYTTDSLSDDIKLATVIAKQDYVVFLTWRTRLLHFAKLFSVPVRISQLKEKYRGSDLATFWLDDGEYWQERFVAFSYAKMIGDGLGIKIDINPHCDVVEPGDEVRKRSSRLQDEIAAFGYSDYALISPTGSIFVKDLTQEVIKNTIEYLTKEKKLACIVTGVSKEKRFAEINDEGVINLVNKTTLPELISIISKANLVVCADSGPMHIATSLRRKTVGVFTWDTPVRWADEKYCFPVTANMPCVHCTPDEARTCSHRDCQNKITFDMVKQQIDCALMTE